MIRKLLPIIFLIVISDLPSFAHSVIYIEAESLIDEINPCDSAIPIKKLVNDLALDQEEARLCWSLSPKRNCNVSTSKFVEFEIESISPSKIPRYLS